MTGSIAHAAAEAARHLADPDRLRLDPVNSQSLAGGAAGIAVLHIERAATGLGDWASAAAWLRAATERPLTRYPRAHLLYGAPAVAFALAGAGMHGKAAGATRTMDHEITRLTRSRLELAHARIDRAEHPALGEYDLFHGLTGLGAHWLRRDPASDALRDVLTYLVRLTEPHPGGLPGWWSNQPPPRPAAEHPGGHGNLGMAHGISGPLALLCLTLRRGITVPGQRAAVERICTWIDAWRQERDQAPWWPQAVTLDDLAAGRTLQSTPGRPSWCYGTPGQARAQQLAGIALGDQGRAHDAERALVGCLEEPSEMSTMVDAGLCHGWAGLYQTAWRISADTLNRDPDGRLSAQLPALAQRLADADSESAVGLLGGAAGRALALHTAITGVTATGWDAFLMLG